MLNTTALAVSNELMIRLTQARTETDQVFGTVKEASLYERPIPERHRIVFYIGHLEAFDWNLLREPLGLKPFHPEFDRLFAFGIDPTDGNTPNDQPSDWPSLTQVRKYCQTIRGTLDSALAEATEREELTRLLNIAIEHRLMHAETLEYMLHQLPYESKLGPEPVAGEDAPVIVPEMVRIPGGKIKVGLERDGNQFGWDNEFEAHVVDVPAFEIDKFKVTNGHFLEFVKAGGYEEASFWTKADWEWKTEAGVIHPVFWLSDRDVFRYRSMFAEIPLPLESPVYVSHAEASAYARWVGKTLPTEAEWQRAAEGATEPKETRVLWDPPFIGTAPETKSVYGAEGLVGTGWEWTSSHFAGFNGFQVDAVYPGYSANFFDNQHFVMKGGSPRTAACMLRPSFRNWFQPHYQYVYAGFRCATREASK